MADIRAKIKANLARLEKLSQGDERTIKFGDKMRGKTYAEAYEDKKWIAWLAARSTPTTDGQEEFLDYALARLEREVQQKEQAMSRECGDWETVPLPPAAGSAAAKIRETTAEQEAPRGSRSNSAPKSRCRPTEIAARVAQLEQEVDQITAIIEQEVGLKVVVIS